MARILVSYYKVQELSIGKVLCFWDGFAKDLAEEGNEVFLINTAYFNPYSSNTIKNSQVNNHLLEKAKQFDPELIITFNHRIPKSFLDYFSEVPTIIWDGDELSFFCDLDYIKKHIKRYQVFSISKGWFKDYTDFGFTNDQISYVPQATSIRKMDIPQTMNVSFLGIRHFHNKKYANLIQTHKYSNRFYSLVEEFLATGNYDYEELFNKHFSSDYPELEMKLRDLYPLFDYRWLVLANMLDLGLTISGHESRWEDVAEFMPQIAAAYNPQEVWTLEQNCIFYNSSKVSLCPITAQARGSAFSWRVFDIMASNACLLISETSDLKALVKDYLDMPMYKTPWEAREMCQKMLSDDTYRQSIVNASQKYVDENARWHHRFLDMQQITGIKVTNALDKPSIYDAVLGDEDLKSIIDKKQSNSYTIKEPLGNNDLKTTLKRLLIKVSQIRWIFAILEFGTAIVVLGALLMNYLNANTAVHTLGVVLVWSGLLIVLMSLGIGALNLAIKWRRSRR